MVIPSGFRQPLAAFLCHELNRLNEKTSFSYHYFDDGSFFLQKEGSFIDG